MPYSMATERPPIRQQTPQKPWASIPIPRSARTIISETRELKGRRGLWVLVQDRGTARALLELGKGRRADRASGVRTGSLGAPWTRADAGHVKEQAHLVHEVQLRISRAPEAHVMALSLLVLLSDAAVKGCPAEVSHEAALSVAVKAPVTGLRGCCFGGKRAAYGRRDERHLVAKSHDVGRPPAEGLINHVARDRELVGKLCATAKQARDAPRNSFKVKVNDELELKTGNIISTSIN
jgi:hypothetical protein